MHVWSDPQLVVLTPRVDGEGVARTVADLPKGVPWAVVPVGPAGGALWHPSWSFCRLVREDVVVVARRFP